MPAYIDSQSRLCSIRPAARSRRLQGRVQLWSSSWLVIRPADPPVNRRRSRREIPPPPTPRHRPAIATRSSPPSSRSLPSNASKQIGLADIAEAAGVTLSQMRGEFPSTLAILAAYLKSVDRAVLAEDMADMAEEPPRERLFDVLMRRLEVMAPHREAVRSLMRSARRNPPLTLALNGLAVRSQQWMLTAAGIKASGPRGLMRAQGLAVLFAAVLRAWVNDDDPGLARTMAALDRALGTRPAAGRPGRGYLPGAAAAVPAALALAPPPRRGRRRGSRRARRGVIAGLSTRRCKACRRLARFDPDQGAAGGRSSLSAKRKLELFRKFRII